MIYLDHAATAPLRREALEAMWPFLTHSFGNPSSTHALGRAAAAGLRSARATVAGVLRCRPSELVLTSGATEANALAVQGTIGLLASQHDAKRANRDAPLAAPVHVITSPIEHPSVLENLRALQHGGAIELTIVPVDHDGRVAPVEVERAIRPSTVLVSLTLVSNEVGVVQPIAEVAARCRATRTRLHTDATQAAGALSLDVDELGVDLLTVSGHKFGGPRGSGALYVRSPLRVVPLLHGGGQERGQRSGTENVAAMAGMAAALAAAEAERLARAQGASSSAPPVQALRDDLVRGICAAVPSAVPLATGAPRAPHFAAFCFPGVDGELITQELEERGIVCSSGSACAAGKDEPSPVLLAMGYDEATARTAVRFTLGPGTTQDEIDQTVAAVIEVLAAAVR